jgi:catalase
MVDDGLVEDGLGERLIDAVHEATGVHPGHRALHAKGVGVLGTFTASGDAAALTTAAHLQAGVVSAVEARFSNGTGVPGQPDGARDGRGFAVKFRLADGSSTDLVGLTLPVFFVRTAADFLELMAARVPDPETGGPDLDKILAFLGEHPEAQRALELSMVAPAPRSYATTRFFGVHTFWYVDADGARHKVAYRWEPEGGVAVLSDEEAAEAAPDYLAAELAERLDRGSAAFTLVLAIGTDEDDENDPTVEWPADRETVTAGRLLLESLPDDPAVIERLIFDPTRVTAGIECPADEILHARSAAYGVSYAARTG